MNYTEFLAYLGERIAKAGSQGKLAQQISVAQGEISAVVNMHQKPGPKLLNALGLKKVSSYEPK